MCWSHPDADLGSVKRFTPLVLPATAGSAGTCSPVSKEATMTSPTDRRGSARTATCFFWIWLMMATAASVAGNVAHAILNAPKETAMLAAAASVVPPVVLLGSTHSVALLVKAGQPSRVYRCALLTTVLLAGCAFALSFDALSDLAAMVGMRSERAWLWPCAIDLSIAQSTLALLALTGSSRPSPRTGVNPSAAGSPSRAGTPAGPEAVVPVPEPVSVGAAEGHRPSEHAPEAKRWHPAARQLIEAGVTQKDVAVVALILAEHDAGIAPSTISRRLDVHHSTVGRILAGAAALS